MTKGKDSLFTPNFVLLCVSSLFFYLSFHVLLPTLPMYVKELGGSKEQIGMVIGAFATSALIGRLPVGWLLDRRGSKGLIIAGTVLFLFSSILYSFANSVALVLAIRLLHGLGMAACNTASSTLVAHAAPETRRGEAMGIFGTAANLSMALGPAAGVLILEISDYQALFTASAVLAFLGLVLAIPLRDYDAAAVQPKREMKASSFYSREALFPSLIVFSVCLTYGVMVAFVALFAMERKLGNPGVFFLYYAFCLAICRAPAGKISDRCGRAAVITPGMGLLVISMLLLAHTRSMGMLQLAAVVYGIASACTHPALMALAVDRVSLRDRGVAMGTFTAGWELGIASGSMVFGYILAATSYEVMFTCAAVAVALGGIAFVIGNRYSRFEEQGFPDCSA